MVAPIDIDQFLGAVDHSVAGKNVPVVDLIAVQTKDPFKVLVATILSARTKDETTAAAAARLFTRAATVAELGLLSRKELEELIFPVGFFRNKANFLHQLPAHLARFGNMVPSSIEDLVTLPGVGRKTANLVRSVAFDLPAICVDTHVHRIMNIWEYVQTDTPHQTEMALRDKLPQIHWKRVNSLLVAFGQSICTPVRPHCDVCPLLRQCPQKGVTPRIVKTRPSTGAVSPIRMISWNVNGIRAIEKKGFLQTIDTFDADIIALQETKAQPEQLSDALVKPDGYTGYFYSAEKKGYSGVAIYSRIPAINVLYGINDPVYDCEGRVLTLELPDCYLVNIYFPNSGEGLKRLDYKLGFNERLLAFITPLKQHKPVILCGDFNVAHQPIDLSNPESNTGNAGYTPDERAWMDRFLASGFTDTFRLFHDEPERYTWWSYRFNARARNIGWRIDYFCVDQAGVDKVVRADILPEVMGSDHCPVLLEYLPTPT